MGGGGDRLNHYCVTMIVSVVFIVFICKWMRTQYKQQKSFSFFFRYLHCVCGLTCKKTVCHQLRNPFKQRDGPALFTVHYAISNLLVPSVGDLLAIVRKILCVTATPNVLLTIHW